MGRSPGKARLMCQAHTHGGVWSGSLGHLQSGATGDVGQGPWGNAGSWGAGGLGGEAQAWVEVLALPLPGSGTQGQLVSGEERTSLSSAVQR